MTIHEHHVTGQSMDDTIGLVALGIDVCDQAALRAEIVRILATNDGPRVVALIEALTWFAIGGLEAMAVHEHIGMREALQRIALLDRTRVPR